MPKKDGDEYIISDTGNWNVADQYAKNKIMRPLNLCDYYEDIAYFGYESLVEELVNYQAPPNDVIKIKATKRLIKELLRLIDNSKFAFKVKGTKDEILGYRDQLEKIQEIIPKLVKIKNNHITHEKKIVIKNHILFEEVLEQISKIKAKINEPLNKNHLIFTDKEEFDAKAFKEGLKQRIRTRG